MVVGENFNFCGFSLNPECFPTNHGLLISNISLQVCYSETFTANSHFPLETWKFPPVDIFPYTVYRLLYVSLGNY